MRPKKSAGGPSRKPQRPGEARQGGSTGRQTKAHQGGTTEHQTKARPEAARRRESAATPTGGGGHIVFGTHAVREILRGKRRTVFAVFATPEAAARLGADLAAAGVRAEIVEAPEIARRLGPNAVHQGVMAEVGPLPQIDLEEIVARSGIVVVLDQITDPHNVGAILRTAAAFGIDALVTTERHSPDFSGIVAKAASGGLEHVPIVTVVNLARTLEALAELGYFRIGLDSEAPSDLAEIDLPRPIALVLGGEGKGLRRLTRENCDCLARLDLPGAIKSLNVSNACAVALTLVRCRLPA